MRPSTAGHEVWARFLNGFARCLQMSGLYEPTHPILQDPIASISAILAELHAKEGQATVHGIDQAIFVNGTRLRTDAATFARHAQFVDTLAQRGIAGVRFKEALDEAQWATLLRTLAGYDRLSATPFEDIRRALGERGLDRVELMPIQHGHAAQRYSEVKMERRVFAVRVVAKTATLLRLYIEHIHDARRQVFYQQRLQRALQDLISMCLDDGWKYVGFVNNRYVEGAIYDHAVNVTLLSVAVGVKIGLRRSRLAELGMAALLHDLGKVLHPAKLMTREDRFSAEDRELLKQSPGFGVRALLQEGPWNEALLKRILVLCEHSAPSEGDAHPFSRLIAVAERFDAFSTARPYRRAHLPDAAIVRLLELKDLDRDLVSAFACTVGLFPPGTVVELASGRIAVAFHPNPDPRQIRAPLVRIVRDAKGREVEGYPVQDLAKEGDSVQWSLDAATTGVEVPRVLAHASE